MRARVFGIVAMTVAIGVPALAAEQDPSPAVGPAPVQLADRLEAEFMVPGSPDWPVAAFDSMWVLAPDLPIRGEGGTPDLVRIDPTTNETIARIALPDRLCQGIVATDDAIWACAIDGLVRVDPATESIATTIPMVGVQGFYRPAFGDGRLWAFSSASFTKDTVVAVDPATRDMTSYALTAPAGGLAYAFDALWLTIPSTGSVARLDPVTGEVEEVVTGLPSPLQIVAGSDSLWVTLYGGEDQATAGDPQLARIDPVTGEVVAELSVGGAPHGGVDVLATDGALLVRSTRPWLTRLDPVTGQVLEVIVAEPDFDPSQGPLAVAFGSIWTVNIEQDSVFRLPLAPAE